MLDERGSEFFIAAYERLIAKYDAEIAEIQNHRDQLMEQKEYTRARLAAMKTAKQAA